MEIREWVDSVAQEIVSGEYGDLDDSDAVWEAADDSEWTIYYGRAVEVVAWASSDEIDAAWEELRGMGAELPDTYWRLHSMLATFILHNTLHERIAEIRGAA